jgi:solute carrier family 25 uncoupling protein 8/9
VANPTDLVKVRLQADGKANTVKRSYSGALNAYATIIRQVTLTIMGSKFRLLFLCLSWSLNLSCFQEGIGALWTGLGPNVARNAIINAAELASYDQFKQVPVDSLLSCGGRYISLSLFIPLFCSCRCF